MNVSLTHPLVLRYDSRMFKGQSRDHTDAAVVADLVAKRVQLEYLGMQDRN